MSKPETTSQNVTEPVNVTYADVTTMERKDIAKELRDIAPRQGRLSLTERNCLEALAEGGKVVSDNRDSKKRHYRHYIEFADGSSVPVRPDGFRYLVSKAKRYGLVDVTGDNGQVVTYTLPKNSNRLAYVKRLVVLFDNC